MKKKLFVTAIVTLLSLCSYSQEHIKFNGATFGKPLNEFIKGFPGSVSRVNSYAPRGYNSNLCNWKCYNMKLNSQNWECHIFSSRTTNTVFRTVSANAFYGDLENQLMLLVKTLEQKYGGGIQEKQENLGEVVYLHTYKKEMLALYYYIKGSNGKRIGEIRISAAPTDKDAKSGYIELSYTDYSAQKLATREYNSLMRNAL